MVKKKYNLLGVSIFEKREEMGKEAANEASLCILEHLKTKKILNCMFAAAPSQNEFLDALSQKSNVPWSRIRAFHMDEYVGIVQGSQNSFSGFLKRKIFDKVPFCDVYLFNGENSAEDECLRYSELLQKYPIDIVFLGIGENGHIAFNDPEVANFKDTEKVKTVKLDEVCRMQQVHDGCFHTLDEVPCEAFTVTIPVMMKAENLFCIVPGKTKARAVEKCLKGEISEACPASILRTHPNAKIYLDKYSAMYL